MSKQTKDIGLQLDVQFIYVYILPNMFYIVMIFITVALLVSPLCLIGLHTGFLIDRDSL